MDLTSALSGTTYVDSATISTTTDTTDEDTLEEQKIEFLTLLITQLENQNPLDPMDTDEYTAQLVSYSQLEQQMEINDTLSTVSDTLLANEATASLSYIGETVEIETDSSVVQDGEISWAYDVSGSASEVYLTIQDSDGNTVWEGDGSLSSSAQILTLNLSEEGVSAEDGEVLTLYVNATDSSGESLDTDVTSIVAVDGVTSDGTDTYLTSGGLSYTMDSVLKIST